MSEKYRFTDGQHVYYSVSSEFSGEGIIRGISSTPTAVIGATYIVEDISGKLPNTEYPYKMFACPEVNLVKDLKYV